MTDTEFDGEATFKRTDEGVEILRADECILINRELLNDLDPRFAALTLTLRGVNRTVKYQLDNYRPAERCYEGHRIAEESA